MSNRREINKDFIIDNDKIQMSQISYKTEEDEEENEEDNWNETVECGSISSEECSDFTETKHLLMSQQEPWDNEQVKQALINLPAGESALSVLSGLHGDSLEKALNDLKNSNAQEIIIKDKSNIINFSNCQATKTSMRITNDEALSSIPGEILAKWPSSCLLIACWLGQYEIVKILLKRGTSVDIHDSDGRTPLHFAAYNGCVKIVDELLEYGADPNKWDSSKKFTALHCAAAVGKVSCIRSLIKYGANVNAGLTGKSPLHYAVLCNACDCVETLLKAKALPNNPQVYTETPLHVAASLGSIKNVELLLAYGADVRVQFGSSRSTPLHFAAEEGSAECTKLLLKSGADCNAKNSRGQTSLHLAALVQSSETLEILINAGGNVNAEDDDGRTPLHTAVAKSLRGSELVSMLIQSGSHVNKPDKFGYTPLHIAALNESSMIVILLLIKGADVTAKTKGGISALSFIIRRTPDVLPRFVSRMDQAISVHDHELGDVDCELRLDFRPLVPGGRGETDLMLCLVDVGQKHILKHPLCESFLYLKWLRIRKFFLFSLIFHLIFAILFTAFVTVTFLYNFSDTVVYILFWPVLLFTFILACKEIFQLAHGIYIYAKQFDNWIQWSVIIGSGVVLIIPSGNVQHHAAGIAILLVWIELMLVVGRFPMFGLYVQMFTQVSINFFKFLGAYLCLLIGFSLSFCVLHNKYKSFVNPVMGFLKTIIMMSGELEFEDVFFDDDKPILYSITAHLILLGFVVLVTIILTNLMVGLAVSDIQELRRCAGLDRLVRRAQLVSHLESMLFSKLLDHCPKKIVRVFRKEALLLHPPHHCAIHIRPNDPREKRLPKDLIKAIFRLVSERKIKAKNIDYINFSSKKSINTVDNRQFSRLCSATSINDDNRQQLSDLSADLKRCSQNINIRLDTLTKKIEDMARDFDLQNEF